jgi:glucarate dehydratase
MKITDITITPVNVPLEAPIRWSWGVRDEANRTIVQLETDEGLVGLGETFGGAHMPVLIDSMKGKLLGENPFNIERILAEFHMLPYFAGYSGRGAVCAVEMACWDLMGKKLEQPLYNLMGGKIREEVEFSAFIFARHEKNGIGGEDTPEKIAAHCLSLQKSMGFNVYKLKGGVFSPEFDLETTAAMAKTLGENIKLRFDPNAVWSLETALRICPKFLEYNMEYLEDIVWGLEASSRLRENINAPMATNMFVVCFEDLPLNARLKAFDVILGDVHKWGGLSATKNLAAVCRTFSWGMSMHSGAELGISTAATIHLAACTPQIYFPLDTHYYHLVDDIIEGERFTFKNGRLGVPDGNGIGVELNKDKLQEYHQRYLEKGAIDHAKGDAEKRNEVKFNPMW